MSLSRRFLNFFSCASQTRPVEVQASPPEVKFEIETANLFIAKDAEEENLLEILGRNQSSCDLQELMVKLNNGDIALAFSNGVSTFGNSHIGIYVFSGNDFSKKKFIPYLESRFLKLFITSEGRLVSTCYHTGKKSMVLNQWSQDLEIESELLIPRYTSFLSASEPVPRTYYGIEPIGFRTPYDLIPTYQVPKYTKISVLKNDRLLCNSINEKTIYLIDLAKNIIENAKIEYGLDEAFFRESGEEFPNGSVSEPTEKSLNFLCETDTGFMFSLSKLGGGFVTPEQNPVAEFIYQENAYVRKLLHFENVNVERVVVAITPNKFLITVGDYQPDEIGVMVLQILERNPEDATQLVKTQSHRTKLNPLTSQHLCLHNGNILFLNSGFRAGEILISNLDSIPRMQTLIAEPDIESVVMLDSDLIVKHANGYSIYQLNKLKEYLLEKENKNKSLFRDTLLSDNLLLNVLVDIVYDYAKSGFFRNALKEKAAVVEEVAQAPVHHL